MQYLISLVIFGSIFVSYLFHARKAKLIFEIIVKLFSACFRFYESNTSRFSCPTKGQDACLPGSGGESEHSNSGVGQARQTSQRKIGRD